MTTASGTTTALPPLTVRREGAPVPRQIVAWLQTLGLSRPVKHPRRDLSNGFLIGEMCARYWDDIPMHSLENKLSAVNKGSNWHMLKKIFARHHAPLSDQMVKGMINQTEGFADYFLRQLYTVLTGRQVREAGPMAAVEVDAVPYNPSRIVHHMKPPEDMGGEDAMEEEADDESPSGLKDQRRGTLLGQGGEGNNTSASAANNRGVTKLGDLQSTTATMQGSEAARPVHVQPIRAPANVPTTSTDPLNPLSAAPLPDDEDPDSRAQVKFSVKVHAAEKTSTVVQNATPTTATDRPQSPLTKSGVPPGGAAPAPTNTMDWMESIIKPFGTSGGWRLTPHYPTYTQYFLAYETDMDNSVLNSVWNTLLARLGELSHIVRSDSIALSTVVSLILVPPNNNASALARRRSRTRSIDSSSIGASSYSPPPMTAAVYRPSARAHGFVASLLSHLTGIDPFYAQATFTRCVLHCPELQPVLTQMDYTTAVGYATLLSAVVSADLPTACQLLPALISSVHEAVVVTGAGVEVASRASFLVFLRTLVPRLIRVNPSGMFYRRASNTRQNEGRGELHAMLYEICLGNAVGALSSSVSSLRLAGGSLAIAIVQCGCPLQRMAIDAIYPLLFPSLGGLDDADEVDAEPQPINDGPWFAVVQAIWLRACQQRFTEDELAAVAAADETSSLNSNPPFAVGPVDEERRSSTSIRTARLLERAFRSMCAYLVTPGGHQQAKAVVAYELACALDAMSLHSPTAAAVANAVMTFFGTRASAKLQAMAVAPSAEAAGRAQQSSSASSNSTAASRDPTCAADHVILGPLCLREMMKRTSPLLLCEALPLVFSNAISEDPKDAARRLVARVAVLARDRSVAVGVRMRIEWLYHVVVGGRGGVPLMDAFRQDATTSKQRWEALARARYDDIALVCMAAEMIHRQGSARVDDATLPLLDLAAMAQGVVMQWYISLSPYGNSGRGDGPLSNGTPRDGPEMAKAMTWFHATFSETDTRR